MAKLTFNLIMVLTGLIVFEVSPNDFKDAIIILAAKLCLALIAAVRAILRHMPGSQKINANAQPRLRF